jgi:peptidoglycan/xylan/chitin deacetylase (PgdA/CDA1 family)
MLRFGAGGATLVNPRFWWLPGLVVILAVPLAVPAEPPSDLRIAVTVDDLPVTPPDRHTTEQQERITARLLATLAAHKVPAIGFVNEGKLEVDGAVDPRRLALLERWLDAGMDLGNHGHSHLDLHRVDAARWLEDVLRGERVTRPLVEKRGRKLQWFRHPFLHAGRSKEVQSQVETFLTRHGYRVAPVTIDNGEWIYGGAYANAWNRGDQELMKRLGEDYLRYMQDVVTFYEDQSEKIVKRRIPQVLLVHAYALNADWLGELLDRLERKGYRWITLDEAMKDPAYQLPADGYVADAGITWLHRWAITAKMDRQIFRGEPEVPGWVEELRQPAGR